MTKAEKRSFSLHAAKYQKSEKTYIQLYQILDQSKSYHKKNIVNSLPNMNLAVQCQYLYLVLIEILKSSKVEKTDVEFEILDSIIEIKILIEKNSLTLALEKIEITKKRCASYELFYLLLQLNELKVFIYQSKSDYIQMYLLINKENKEVIDKLDQINDLSKLNFEITDLALNKEGSLAKQDFTKHPLLQNENNCLSCQAKIIFNNSKSFYFYHIGKLLQTHQCNKRIVELYEQMPGLLEIQFSSYINLITNICLTYIAQRDTKSLDIEIAKLQTLSKRFVFAKQKRYSDIIEDKKIRIRAKQFIEYADDYSLVKCSDAIIQNFKSPTQIKDLKNKYSILFQLCRASFRINNYTICAKCINLLITNSNEFIDQEMYQAAFFIRWMMHYELKNKDLLPSFILDIKKKFSDDLTQDYLRFLQLFEALLELKTRKERQVVLKNFLKISHVYKHQINTFFNDWLNKYLAL